MSYGFYKMPPRSTHEEYIAKLIGPMAAEQLLSKGKLTGEELKSVKELEPPKVADTLLDAKMAAKAQGYSGNICTNCHGARLKRAGHCEVCDDCGTTTGCS